MMKFKSSSFSKASSTDSTLVNTVNGETEGLSYTSSIAEIEAHGKFIISLQIFLKY
jgi:hypothetical protein